jgi:hypothetical protein
MRAPDGVNILQVVPRLLYRTGGRANADVNFHKLPFPGGLKVWKLLNPANSCALDHLGKLYSLSKQSYRHTERRPQNHPCRESVCRPSNLPKVEGDGGTLRSWEATVTVTKYSEGEKGTARWLPRFLLYLAQPHFFFPTTSIHNFQSPECLLTN